MAAKKKTKPKFLERGKIDRSQLAGRPQSDLGSPELENHHALSVEYVDADGEPETPEKGHKRVRNRTQTTLDYCEYHGIITLEQYAAGEQLYRDCYWAGLVPRAMVGRFDGLPPSRNGRFNMLEGKVESERRYRHISKTLALRMVDRRRLISYWDVCYKICVESMPLDGLEKWCGWSRRSGKHLLIMVLDELVDEYESLRKRR